MRLDSEGGKEGRRNRGSVERREKSGEKKGKIKCNAGTGVKKGLSMRHLHGGGRVQNLRLVRSVFASLWRRRGRQETLDVYIGLENNGRYLAFLIWAGRQE